MGFDRLTPASLGPGKSREFAGGLLERGANGGWTWTVSFSSQGAGALRLHIRRATLPAGSEVFVYAPDGQIHGPYAFDSGTRPEGFWTNTIFGEQMFLQVQFGAVTAAAIGKAVLLVASVVHLEHPGFAPGAADRAAAALRPKSDDCFIDRSCVTTDQFPNVDDATRSIGQLTFMITTGPHPGAYICTGGLLNTTDGSSVPYLLTANRLLDSQASATSLEAFWQYRTAFCGAGNPNENLFPSTLGSELLATGAAPSSDFTFVRLLQPPPNDSVLLGWTTADVAHAGGLMLYRLSYANGDPMIYTQEQISAVPSPAECLPDAPQGAYLYEKDVQGGTGGGSSGSPLYTEDLRVVGQLFGACGTNEADNCDAINNSTIDGAFRVTFPSIQQWIAPGTRSACVADATTLCLNGGRFRVTAYYSADDGASGAGNARVLTGDSGYFWFFDAANIELVVKVLDACTFSTPNFWVFAGGLTNVGVNLIVEDTVTGASQTYTNPIGNPYQPLQDTRAFPCP